MRDDTLIVMAMIMIVIIIIIQTAKAKVLAQMVGKHVCLWKPTLSSNCNHFRRIQHISCENTFVEQRRTRLFPLRRDKIAKTVVPWIKHMEDVCRTAQMSFCQQRCSSYGRRFCLKQQVNILNSVHLQNQHKEIDRENHR